MLATTLTTALALYTSLTTAHPLAPRTKDLWHPTPGTTWQIILSDIIAIPTSPSTPLTPDVDVYDVDMFGTSAATIAALHARGKKVVCYFSAGSYEPGRPDSDQFADGDLGAVMDGWPDERWVDVRSGNVVRIMEARVRVAAEKGCDAVDPDNLDGYVWLLSSFLLPFSFIFFNCFFGFLPGKLPAFIIIENPC
ncbi:hypothetical protein EJ05DRAFT_474352 [Pseudovirgaria hyperparasitica]|uniref:alpha-galactosidase n=1 Tax=Pseudovirgaria hyperparasitica TaxID=470096 RepID=A0A6A6WCP1_9PEZI|nr:uncharacterized protein EJ05DRAFT_474352 [Pseudovirgaria hyperparasitica]KAF2760473.1 hypothetical protein EJ05DRAFT_474352 [Pseudovirgaria hyperparasitica]